MKYVKSSFSFLIMLSSLVIHHFAYAAPQTNVGLGQVAQNLMEPVSLFADFVQTGCFILGASFIFASIIKYVEHRRSPLMVPISTVVFLLIAGIILILLPFLSFVTGSGVPLSLMK